MIANVNHIYRIQGTDDPAKDGPAITTARDALVKVGGGTIVFDGTLNLAQAGLLRMGTPEIPIGLLGDSSRAQLRFSGDPLQYLFWGHLGYIFPSNTRLEGSVVPIPTFGAHDRYRWRQFTCDDADQLAVGDWIYVWSEHANDNLADQVEVQWSPTSHHPGEFVRIKEINGTTVTLDQYVQDWMTQLWIHKRPICRAPALRIGNFSVLCDQPNGATRTLAFRAVVGGLIENIDYVFPAGTGVAISGCADMTVRGLCFGGTTGPNHLTGICATSLTASTNILIEDVTSQDCHHHFDTSAAASVDNKTRIGTNRGCIIRNWRARQMAQYPNTAAPIHTHEGGYGMVFESCSVTVSAMMGVAYGFQARARATQFRNCRVEGTTSVLIAFLIASTDCEIVDSAIHCAYQGIWCTNANRRNGDRCLIKGNTFDRVRSAVILDSDNNEVVGNLFRQPVPISATGVPYGHLMVKKGGQRIVGNHFQRLGDAPHGAIAIYERGAVKTCIGNTFDGWGMDERSDCPFYNSGSVDRDSFQRWKDRNSFN